MKTVYVAFIAICFSCMQCFCMDKFTIGFGVQNSTPGVLKIASVDDSIKFTDGTLEPKKERFFASGYKTCRVILDKGQFSHPKTIAITDAGSTPLFNIRISFVESSPVLEIVDIASELVKQRLYTPSIGGGYNFTLAVGNSDKSVNVESVQHLQPCGLMQPYLPDSK